MTGDEHYIKAEAELQRARSDKIFGSVERHLLASAQIHATLALAAATDRCIRGHEHCYGAEGAR